MTTKQITAGRLRALEQMRLCHARTGDRNGPTHLRKKQLEFWRNSLDFWNRKMMEGRS